MKLALLLLLLSPLHATIVLLPGAEKPLAGARTEVVVVHRQTGRQQLLVRVTPIFSDLPPSRVALLIPLPAPPLAHGVAEPAAVYDALAVHPRLFTLARQQWSDRTEYEWPEAITWLRKSESVPDAEPSTLDLSGLEIGELRDVAVCDNPQLTQWLDGRGYTFKGEAPCWLVMQIVAVGKERLGRCVETPPLRISLESAQPWLPLGPHSGAIDASIITDQPLDTDPFMAFLHAFGGMSKTRVVLVNLWSVQALPAGVADDLATPQPYRWYANRVVGAGSAEAGQLHMQLPTGDIKDELPGFWYYGDDDISWAEEFFREHALAIMTTSFLLLVVVMIFKTRANRARLVREGRLPV